jgi:hypothetical protein
MSAFIVSDTTLQIIVRFLDLDVRFSNSSKCYGCLNRILQKQGFNLEFPEHKDRLIKEMALLNRLGVNERYNENELEMQVRYIDAMPPSLMQAYKSLGCFLYQCCEGDIPEKNDLYKMFEEIKNQMAHAIIRTFKEYDEAKWDI